MMELKEQVLLVVAAFIFLAYFTYCVLDGSQMPAKRLHKQKSKARLTHLVIPFHINHINRMESFFARWDKYPPCLPKNKLYPDKLSYSPPLGFEVHLVLYAGGAKNTTDVLAKAMAYYERLPMEVKKCFASVSTRSLYITPAADRYPTGPNKMFNAFLSNYIGLTPAPHYVFLMEPDVKPVRKGWLSVVDGLCRWPNSPFWIKGSQLRSYPLPLDFVASHSNKLQINGNAIYNLNDPKFLEFYENEVLPTMANMGVNLDNVPYDTFAARFLYENDSGYRRYYRKLHKFVWSDFIQNRWHVNSTLKEVLEDSESTVLIHGGYVFDD